MPFLLAEVGSTRALDRFVANTPAEALQAARQVAAAQTGASAFAYVYDGYANTGTERVDAVLVEVSQRGRPTGLRSHETVVRRGGLLNRPCESWFARAT